jgi:hypothetical protein
VTFRIKNWAQFQHFKDRRPPWVKLYRDILDDIDWHELDPQAAKVLVMLWLIASESDGNLPDTKKLAFRLRLSESKTSDVLSKLSHWLEQIDINAISARYQDDAPETEGETDTEEERDSLSAAKLPPCPHQELIALFGKHLPMLSQPKPELWKGKKADAMKARWVWALTTISSKTSQPYATDAATALAFFERYFAYVAKSDFLTGKSGAWTGCSLEWLMTEANFAKALEGQYENKAAA